jgi:tetratricopeptide (TPR) repeat protein
MVFKKLVIKKVVIKNIHVIFWLSLCLSLFGCANNSTQESSVPVVDSNVVTQTPNISTPETTELPIESEQVQPKVPPVKPQAAPGTGNAVASLIAQANSQFQAKNYQAAIATAERGLRIDRRAPELYLVLAKSYVQLANIPLAEQFVQQGIRYAQAGSDIALSLLKVKNTLAH